MDANKTLDQLYQQWCRCTQCELGQRREAVGGRFVFGEGAPRGILFVAEGPGRNEEEQGRPFVGPSGTLLRSVLKRYGLKNYYMTNVVACRSCSPVLDETGQPRFTRARPNYPAVPIYRDEPPTDPQRQKCTPRLLEQIYLIDPVLIVSLGGPATEVLVKKSVAITSERGKERHITIPGASWKPSLTEKRGAWLRKVGGEMKRPVEQNEVRYLLLPTFHPAFVLRQFEDRRPTGAFPMFCADLRKAVKIYEQIMAEVYGLTIGLNDISNDELESFVNEAQNQMTEGEEEHGE